MPDEDNIIELGGRQELAPDVEFNRAINLAAALFFSRGGTWQVAHAVLCANVHTLISQATAQQDPPPDSPILTPGA